MLEQLVSSQQLTLKICRNQKDADDYPRDNVANDYLQICEVAAVFRSHLCRKGKRGNTHERQRARLSGNY